MDLFDKLVFTPRTYERICSMGGIRAEKVEPSVEIYRQSVNEIPELDQSRLKTVVQKYQLSPERVTKGFGTP
jgi:hypothetical protein